MRPIHAMTVTRAGGSGGGGGSLDTQAVTVGAAGSGNPSFDRDRGYFSNGSFDNGHVIGSISDGTANVYSGASILALGWSEGSGYRLIISGLVANSGWTSITIAGTTTLNRASATYVQTGGNTWWTWNQDTVFTQAFGPSGVKNVAFN